VFLFDSLHHAVIAFLNLTRRQMGAILLLLIQLGIEETPQETELNKTRFSSFLGVSKNFSILGVGFTIVVTMLILWLIPSILSDMAKFFFSAVKDYPWFFIGVSTFVGGLLVWVI